MFCDSAQVFPPMQEIELPLAIDMDQGISEDPAMDGIETIYIDYCLKDTEEVELQ